MEVIKRKLQLSKLHFIALVLILIAGLIGGYFFYKNYQTNKDKSSIPGGWAQYEDEKYGIKFNYRLDWGTPKIIESAGDKGKSYVVQFTEEQKESRQFERTSTLLLRIESNDYTKKICAVDEPTSCGTIKALSISDITSRLKNKTGLAEYDETSYSTIAAQGVPNNTKMLALTVAKIIDLKKMNASSLHATYTMFGAAESCNETIESDSSKNCLNKNHYSDLQNMLASIKNI